MTQSGDGDLVLRFRGIRPFRKKGVALGDTVALGVVFLEGLAGKP